MIVLFVGDEMGMLEDVCVSIANLTCVKFKVNMRLLSSFVNFIQDLMNRELVQDLLIEQDTKMPK